MTATALLEKSPLQVLDEQDFVGFTPALAPVFEKAASRPFDVSFEVEHVPAHSFHSEVFNVFMNAGGESFQIDTVPALCLPQDGADQKVRALEEAYTEARNNLSVTFQTASEKPRQMAGWTVLGGDRRFVLEHRGEKEVLRNMAYVVGRDAHALLGIEFHNPSNIARAQMIFKY